MSPIISPEELARMQFEAMASGDAALALKAISPDHVNHMAFDEPPACALPGLPGFLATNAWLRLAFSDMRFEITDLVADDETTIASVTFSGRQTGPFVVFPPGGRAVAFPPTGRSFSVRHCHIFHRVNGLHADHAAVRDDLGMMTQLGHLPPSPAFLLRMLRFNIAGGHRRAVSEAVRVAEQAAANAPLMGY